MLWEGLKSAVATHLSMMGLYDVPNDVILTEIDFMGQYEDIHGENGSLS